MSSSSSQIAIEISDTDVEDDDTVNGNENSQKNQNTGHETDNDSDNASDDDEKDIDDEDFALTSTCIANRSLYLNQTSNVGDVGNKNTYRALQSVHQNARASHKVDDPVVALCELIDNSIQALLESYEVDKTNNLFVNVTKDKLNKLVVFDTGCGMTEEQLRSAANLGGGGRELDAHGMNLDSIKSFERSLDNPFRIGEIGRYGIGKMAPYSLGKKVVMETKHATSSDVFVKEEIDREDNKVEIQISSRAPKGSSEMKYNHWTRVTITHLDKNMFQEKLEDVDEKSLLEDKKDITIEDMAEEISMKYFLFLHGTELFPNEMRAFIFPSKETLPKIQINFKNGNDDKIDLSLMNNPLIDLCNSMKKLKVEEIKIWKVPHHVDKRVTVGLLCLGYFPQWDELINQPSTSRLGKVVLNKNERQIHVFVNGRYLSDESIHLKILDPPTKSGADDAMLKMGLSRLKGFLILTTKADHLEVFAFEKHKRSLEKNFAYEQLIKGEGKRWKSIQREVRDFVKQCAEKDEYLFFSESTFIDHEAKKIQWKRFTGPFGEKRSTKEVLLNDFIKIGNSNQLVQVKQIRTDLIENIPTEGYITSPTGVVEVSDALILEKKSIIKPLVDVKKVLTNDEIAIARKDYEKRFPGDMEITLLSENEAKEEVSDDDGVDNNDRDLIVPLSIQQPQNKQYPIKLNQPFKFKVKIINKEKKNTQVSYAILRMFKFYAELIFNNQRILNGVNISRVENIYYIEGHALSIPGKYEIRCTLAVDPTGMSQEIIKKYNQLSVSKNIDIFVKSEDVNHLSLFPYRKSDVENTLSSMPYSIPNSSQSIDDAFQIDLPADVQLSFRVIGQSKDNTKYLLSKDQIDISSIEFEMQEGNIQAQTIGLRIDEHDGEIILSNIKFKQLSSSSSDALPITSNISIKLSIKDGERRYAIQNRNVISVKFVNPVAFMRWNVETNKVWIPGETIPASTLQLPRLLASDRKFNIVWKKNEQFVSTTIEVDVTSSGTQVPEFPIPESLTHGDISFCLQTEDKLFYSNFINLRISPPSLTWIPPPQSSGVIIRQEIDNNLIIASNYIMNSTDLGSISIKFPEGCIYENDMNLGDEYLNRYSHEFRIGGSKKKHKDEKWINGEMKIPKLPINKKDSEMIVSMLGCDINIYLAQSIKLISPTLELSTSLKMSNEKEIPDVSLLLVANEEKILLSIEDMILSQLGVKVSLNEEGNELTWNEMKGRSIQFFPSIGNYGFLSDDQTINPKGVKISGLKVDGSFTHKDLIIELITNDNKSWSEKLQMTLIPPRVVETMEKTIEKPQSTQSEESNTTKVINKNEDDVEREKQDKKRSREEESKNTEIETIKKAETAHRLIETDPKRPRTQSIDNTSRSSTNINKRITRSSAKEEDKNNKDDLESSRPTKIKVTESIKKDKSQKLKEMDGKEIFNHLYDAVFQTRDENKTFQVLENLITTKKKYPERLGLRNGIEELFNRHNNELEKLKNQNMDVQGVGKRVGARSSNKISKLQESKLTKQVEASGTEVIEKSNENIDKDSNEERATNPSTKRCMTPKRRRNIGNVADGDGEEYDEANIEFNHPIDMNRNNEETERQPEQQQHSRNILPSIEQANQRNSPAIETAKAVFSWIFG